MFRPIYTVFAATMIVSGCNAPERSGKPTAAAATTPPSESIVTVELQDLVGHKPVHMKDEVLLYIREEADELAAVSRLALLTDKSPSEVRIWETFANFNPNTIGYETVGYIISPSRALRCEIEYPPDSHVPSKGTCASMTKESHYSKTTPLLDTLLSYADFQTGCGHMDGSWYSLDIVHHGNRFVVSANNPQSCNDAGSEAVSSLIQAVGQLR
jgi:hypothetical protein